MDESLPREIMESQEMRAIWDESNVMISTYELRNKFSTDTDSGAGTG